MWETIQLVLRFVVQMLVAAVLFAAVAGIAFGLSLGSEWLQKQGVPDYINLGVSGVTALLFTLDVICFVCFTVAEAWKLLRDIYRNI
jgi:hypothetical protein